MELVGCLIFCHVQKSLFSFSVDIVRCLLLRLPKQLGFLMSDWLFSLLVRFSSALCSRWIFVHWRIIPFNMQTTWFHSLSYARRFLADNYISWLFWNIECGLVSPTKDAIADVVQEINITCHFKFSVQQLLLLPLTTVNLCPTAAYFCWTISVWNAFSWFYLTTMTTIIAITLTFTS